MEAATQARHSNLKQSDVGPAAPADIALAQSTYASASRSQAVIPGSTRHSMCGRGCLSWELGPAILGGGGQAHQVFPRLAGADGAQPVLVQLLSLYKQDIAYAGMDTSSTGCRVWAHVSLPREAGAATLRRGGQAHPVVPRLAGELGAQLLPQLPPHHPPQPREVGRPELHSMP